MQHTQGSYSTLEALTPAYQAHIFAFQGWYATFFFSRTDKRNPGWARELDRFSFPRKFQPFKNVCGANSKIINWSGQLPSHTGRHLDAFFKIGAFFSLIRWSYHRFVHLWDSGVSWGLPLHTRGERQVSSQKSQPCRVRKTWANGEGERQSAITENKMITREQIRKLTLPNFK